MLKSCIALIHTWYPNKRRAKGMTLAPFNPTLLVSAIREHARCVVRNEHIAGPVMRENVIRQAAS